MRNAVEHGSPDESGSADGGQDRITVAVGALDDDFYVEDDGAGVPPELRSRIFGTGFSTDTAGIDFGLTIASDVADAHGWTVSVKGSTAGDARFRLTGVGAGG